MEARVLEEVVLVDERRFLVSEAAKHFVLVDLGTVKGERKVVIENGRCMIDVLKSVWVVWRKYEKRGEKERKGEKTE